MCMFFHDKVKNQTILKIENLQIKRLNATAAGTKPCWTIILNTKKYIVHFSYYPISENMKFQ